MMSKKFILPGVRRSVYAALFATTAIVPIGSGAWAEDSGAGAPSAPAEITDTAPAGAFSDVGFAISIDDAPVAGTKRAPVTERRQERAVTSPQVQVKFDGLDAKPILNITTADLGASYRAGETLRFRASTNYPAYITRGEVRIMDLTRPTKPLVAKLPIAPNGVAAWTMPSNGEGEYGYVLRVYDAQGRYDETIELPLLRTARADLGQPLLNGPIAAAGQGEDRTARRRIRVQGGAVTAFGDHVRRGQSVMVMGETVPVDANGKFVIQRILPPGEHDVRVEVRQGNRTLRDITREIDIPKSEWFYVGIVDATLSKRIEDTLEQTDDVQADGRMAVYAKGRIKGSTLITLSVDTGEGELDDLFGRLNDKDPRRVLDRLDPEDYYLVYGDDSTSYDDAPTSGRIYLRVERKQGYAVWGDFKADIAGNTMLRNDRSLYGGKLAYQSDEVTTSGNARLEAQAYAAQPDTLPQRDVLRGTGGSAYFLSRQDINGYSETLMVEVRDPDTGRIIERRTLERDVDYDIDYLQGVVILRRPLSSSAPDNTVVRDGGLGSNEVNLVATYEYTPTFEDVGGNAVGGRVQGWANDRLRFGVTAMRETTGAADQDMQGVDARYEVSDNSWLEAEVAQTKGPGFGNTFSTDGGFTLSSEGTSGTARTALAYRLAGRMDLIDAGLDREGFVGFYHEHKDGGFSTLDDEISQDQNLYGVYGEVDTSDRITLRFSGEQFDRAGGDRRSEVDVSLAYALDDVWTVETGLAFDEERFQGRPGDGGARLDLGVRVTYKPNEDREVYVFGQGTVMNDGGLDDNNRMGVGGSVRLGEHVRLGGEVSGGDGGVGGLLKLGYAPTAGNEVYLGYTLDPTREVLGRELSGDDGGTFVVGGRRTYSEQLTTYGENKYDMFGNRRSLTNNYGVNYSPNQKWTFSGAMEAGKIADDVDGDFTRRAISLGATYAEQEGLEARLRLERRHENGEGTTRDRDTWLLSGGTSYQTSDDWRVLTKFDAFVSDSDQSSFLDGEFIEASVGYAYRPVENNRFNGLMKLSYLRDLPASEQLTVDDSDEGPSQKSVIASVDVNYNISPKLTLGGKYGYRFGEVAPRGTDDFVQSSAHLGVLRADWHVVHKWDVMAEGRVLWSPETGTRDTGGLVGVYRHLGSNAKVGLGYEYGNVSDNLADIDYEHKGVFLNVIGKF